MRKNKLMWELLEEEKCEQQMERGKLKQKKIIFSIRTSQISRSYFSKGATFPNYEMLRARDYSQE